MPNKPLAEQCRHIQLGQRFTWNGQWNFDDGEPGSIDPDEDGWKVEVLSKSQPTSDGQRVYNCRIYDGPSHVGLHFFINENNLGGL